MMFKNSEFLRSVMALIIVWHAVLCATSVAAEADPRKPAPAAEPVYAHAAVAADHPLASQAGVEILKQGGNVVDAAVATAFTLSVVRPASCGIGGGGFMLIWDAAKGRAVAIDYRETAPAKASRDMYVDPADSQKTLDDLSRFDALAVAVPGEVAGLCYALKEYGTLDLKTVLAPSLRLCQEGFVVDAHDREVQAEILDDFKKRPQFKDRFALLYRLYLNGGRPWGADDKFHSPLGPVLEQIAAHGPDGFYRGPVAEAIVAEMQRTGGLISLDDLAAVRPTVRQPLTAKIDDLDLFTMPPPSSGGVALLETINILTAAENRFAQPQAGKPAFDSSRRLHLLAEAFKHAFADRAEFLGDADFADVPVERLVSTRHATALAARINPARTQPSDSYGRFGVADDSGTSHFSIIDAAGNAVACTDTINLGFGSFVVEPKFGIILNNEMDDFTSHPGRPNAFGLKQSAANAIAPGKRPLSSMTPTIVVREGKAVFALGGSGGPKIITATAQVLFNLTQFEMSPEQAVAAPRIHHQWMPDRLDLERGFKSPVAEQLRMLGHSLRPVDESAVVQAVSRRPDGLRGASDLRKHGRAAGY
ncbi:MAG: gamma-glutamyltransferase [Planctomycetaceae bacterium]|nr:gamma-glutamyltransferase [Planctomycetaceae bacterium]